MSISVLIIIYHNYTLLHCAYLHIAESTAQNILLTDTFKCSSRMYILWWCFGLWIEASNTSHTVCTYIVTFAVMCPAVAILCVQGHSCLSCCRDVCVRFAHADTHTQDGWELFVGAMYAYELTLVGVGYYVTYLVVMVRLYLALSCVYS